MNKFNISMVCTDSTARFGPIVFREISAESLARMKAIGFNGVEINIKDPSDINLKAFIEMLEQWDMPVTALGTGRAFGEDGLSFIDPDPKIRQKAVDRIKQHVDFSGRVGRPVVIIGLIRGKIFDPVSIPRATARMEECLVKCAEYAREANVKLAIEPINRYETALINDVKQGLELIDRLGMDNIGLLLDTFHMNIEEPVIEESIRKAGKRIFHFHVADSNRRAPGYGHIDFLPVLRELYATGYEGFISGELLPVPDPETAARKTYDFMKDIFTAISNE